MNTRALATLHAAAPRAARRPGRASAAFDGLTPTTLVVVLAIQLACALGIALSKGMQPGLLAATWTQFVLLVVGTTPMLLGIVVTGNLGPPGGAARLVALALAVVGGFALATCARLAALHFLGVRIDTQYVVNVLRFAGPRFLLLGTLMALALEFFRHAQHADAAARQAEVDRAALEREWDAARLNMLRAQVEPHFLFNSLAHLRHLCETDVQRGRAMLDSLMAYLAAALPKMRQSETTLGEEADLAAAYLQVQQMRMGRRLSYSVDIAPALRTLAMPPMMLMTLVENAVKHGLQPARQGGTLRISAARGSGDWQLSVADTGVGIAPGAGSGTGLSNIRARLAAQFGERAALVLQGNDLGGVTAAITLPLPAGHRAAP